MNHFSSGNQLSRLSILWEPTELISKDNLVLDTFRHFISARDGLPPYSQAKIINKIANELAKSGRPDPCLWVSVDAPGVWYMEEIKRLIKCKIPILVLPTGKRMNNNWDFKPHAHPQARPTDVPLLDRRFNLDDYGLTKSSLCVLQILARLKTAYTREITSLAGFSETHVRTQLKSLQADHLIEWKKIGKYDGWQIQQKGLRVAHRSWNIPKGMHFAPFRQEYRYAGERHRRIARMWRTWLETAYDNIDIWDCWTEVPVQKGIPDALAWGTHNGEETLFWLEVDTGHSSRRTMERIYKKRIRLADQHAYVWKIPVVFCILGAEWVVKSFRSFIPGITPRIAIIGHNWRDFGKLPMYEMGKWTDDLALSRFMRSNLSGAELSFDPKQYPRKPKTQILKPSKPKSTKRRFTSPAFDDDRDWVPSRSEMEE
jgi:hypothetical protein